MTQIKSNRDDLRVKRTHKLILEAMIELTAKQGFSALTVNDIANYAGINRATFYRHYKDKFDLLDQYAQAVYELPNAPFDGGVPRSRRGREARIVPGLVNVFEHIRANDRFFRVMLGKNGDPAFSEKIRQFIRKRIRGLVPTKLQGKQTLIELYINYISSGSLGALIWWLEHDMPYSPTDLDVIFHRLNGAVLSAVLTGADDFATPKRNPAR
jgi:AcrR family transcriptional regulator